MSTKKNIEYLVILPLSKTDILTTSEWRSLKEISRKIRSSYNDSDEGNFGSFFVSMSSDRPPADTDEEFLTRFYTAVQESQLTPEQLIQKKIIAVPELAYAGAEGYVYRKNQNQNQNNTMALSKNDQLFILKTTQDQLKKIMVNIDSQLDRMMALVIKLAQDSPGNREKNPRVEVTGEAREKINQIITPLQDQVKKTGQRLAKILDSPELKVTHPQELAETVNHYQAITELVGSLDDFIKSDSEPEPKPEPDKSPKSPESSESISDIQQEAERLSGGDSESKGQKNEDKPGDKKTTPDASPLGAIHNELGKSVLDTKSKTSVGKSIEYPASECVLLIQDMKSVIEVLKFVFAPASLTSNSVNDKFAYDITAHGEFKHFGLLADKRVSVRNNAKKRIIQILEDLKIED